VAGGATTRVLHAFPPSGNCQRVRVFLSMLGLPYEERLVDIRRGDQRTPGFLALNPSGLVPVLVEDGRVLRDSHAILLWLARAHGGPRWWPEDPWTLAQQLQWVSFSANEIHHGPNMLRRHHRLGTAIDVEATTRRTLDAMATLEARLRDRDWLEGDAVSIADVAVYPYVEALPDAKLSLAPWPAVRAWLERIAALPGWLPMPMPQPTPPPAA
jgi:glutathione S-transferase